MNDRSAAPVGAMTALRTEASERWSKLPSRERTGISTAVVVILIALVWMAAVAPALRTLKETPAQLNALDAELQSMQRMAADARDLRGTSPVPTMQAGLALKSATDRLGERGRINLQGDRATLTLNGVDAQNLRAWLSEARSGARARPVEAQLTRGAQGYAGTIVVTVGGGQ